MSASPAGAGHLRDLRSSPLALFDRLLPAVPGPPAAASPAMLLDVAPAGRESVRVTGDCTACGACLATCPERALRRAPKRPAVVDAACTACWACIEICPAGAIVAARASTTVRTEP